MLEAAQHETNIFATLTYDVAHCPGGGNLNPKHLQDFIKRLRKSTTNKLRYYCCGEYGEKTGRPHYHLAIFNHETCHRGITSESRASCCPVCDSIAKLWGMGKIQIGTLEQSSAAYLAGYVTKKYSSSSTEGKQPQFTRMSNRPGLGLGMMHELASTLLQHSLEKELIDVPISLQHGTHQWPLGRYLRRNLRKYIGRHPNAPQAVLDDQETELQIMRQAAWDNQTSLKTEILNGSLGRRIQINARQRRRKRETI